MFSKEAIIFFQQLDRITTQTSSRILEKLATTQEEQQNSPAHPGLLDAVMKDELNVLMWQVLAVFDNVGSVLPEGLLGLTISVRPTGEDIRYEYDDYADMWLDYQARKLV